MDGPGKSSTMPVAPYVLPLPEDASSKRSPVLDIAHATVGIETATATPLLKAHTSDFRNEPPCTCWDRRDYKDQKPVSLHLPPIKAEIRRTVEATNNIIHLLQRYHNAQLDASPFMSEAELREKVLSQRTVVLRGLESAAVHITSTPGYVCSIKSKQHQEIYELRYRALCELEGEFALEDTIAKEIYEARDELLRAERNMHRREHLQTAVRAASVIAIPFSPFASAVLTAVDVMFLSVIVGYYHSCLPGAQQVREAVDRLEAVQKKMEDKLEEVRKMKASLEAAKARADAQQQEPMASHLVVALEEVWAAKEAVEAVFSSIMCDARVSVSAPISVRRVNDAFRKVGAVLQLPGLLTEPIGSMDDEQLDALDRCLADLRRSQTHISTTPF